VSEKQKALDRLLEKYKTEIEKAKKDLVIDYLYCPNCKDYYKKSAWETGKRAVKRVECTNPLTGGYLDDYEYEEVTETQYYYECPKGHKIVEYYGC
jgi:hypothetical protein